MNPQSDPLAALRPLHAPEPVSWWPPAPGWWLLALLALGLLILALGWSIRRYRRNAYRRQALRELQQLLGRGDCQAATLSQLNALLKRVALARGERHAAAGLCGEDWLEFLDRGIGRPAFSQGPGRALVEQAYCPGGRGDGAALAALCREWIGRAR